MRDCGLCGSVFCDVIFCFVYNCYFYKYVWLVAWWDDMCFGDLYNCTNLSKVDIIFLFFWTL